MNCVSLQTCRLHNATNLDVLGEEAVEEVGVGCAEMSQVLVLVNRRVLGSEQPQTCGAINLRCSDGSGEQLGSVLHLCAWISYVSRAGGVRP